MSRVIVMASVLLALGSCSRPPISMDEGDGEVSSWALSSWGHRGSREGEIVEVNNFEFHADGTFDYHSERCGGDDDGLSSTALSWERVDDDVIKLERPSDLDYYFGAGDGELYLRRADEDCRLAYLYDEYRPDNSFTGLEFRLGEYCLDLSQGCEGVLAVQMCKTIESCPAEEP